MGTYVMATNFALCPDDRPPRLIRFVQGPLGYLAHLDYENNVLTIDKDEYEQRLTPVEQHALIRMNDEFAIDGRTRLAFPKKVA